MTQEASTVPPWLRPRHWLIAGVILIAFISAWVVLETRNVQFSEPNISTDYRAEFRDYVSQHVDLGENDGAEAWRVLKETVEQIDIALAAFTTELKSSGDFEPRFEYDDASPDFTYAATGTSIPDDAVREREAIAMLRQRGLFDQLDRFVELAPAYNPAPADDIREFVSSAMLHAARATVRDRAASLRFALDENDFGEVIRGVEQGYAIGHSMALQPGMMNMLIGRACHQLILQELRLELMEADFDEATCYRLLGIMDQFALPSPQFMLEGERAYLYDLLQHSFSDAGNGNGYMLIPDALDQVGFEADDSKLSFVDAFKSRFLLPDRRQTAAVIDDAFNLLNERAANPYHERDTTDALDEYISSISSKHELVAVLLPALDRALTDDAHARTISVGTRVMLALAIYRDRHGTYPASLDELVPDILPEPHIDPLHGGSFGYRLVEDDEHNRPYLLYSFGIDGTDNHGDVPHRGDSMNVLQNREVSAQYDYIFNTPRREWDPD